MNAPAKTCPQCGQTYDAEQRFCPRDGSTLRTPVGSDLAGSVLAGRYHIVRRIGEGGMGQVYLAEHVRMRRRSAVKVLHQGLVNDADAIARFNREAANASQIQHPNVAAIYDFGETDDGLIYLAMEFVDGEPLRNVIERLGALNAAEAAEIVRQIADALEAAHELGIVHRDLKPDNIMITRDRSGRDLAKVVDFGIAKATGGNDQKVTRTGLAVGTPEYMSPEQLSGELLDARSDIYSLGLVAFNMLTGQLPFPAVSSREAMIARLTSRPRTLAEIKDDVEWPADLQTVMNRALASEPRDRYEHASQFGRDLVKGVAAMPRSALSTTGTLAMPVAHPGTVLVERPATPLRAPGAAPAPGSRAASPPTATFAPAPASASAVSPPGAELPRPTTRPAARAEPLIALKREEGDDVGRFILKTFVVLALLAGAGGAWYVMHSRGTLAGEAESPAPTATPVAPSATDSTHRDSATHPVAAPPRASSIAAKAPDTPAAAANATATSVATPLATAVNPPPQASSDSSAAPPAGLDSVLAPIRDDISVGRSRMADGEYEGAQVRFAQAGDQLGRLGRPYAARAEVAALRHDLSQAMDANRRACRAEKQLDERRGQTGPNCP